MADNYDEDFEAYSDEEFEEADNAQLPTTKDPKPTRASSALTPETVGVRTQQHHIQTNISAQPARSVGVAAVPAVSSAAASGTAVQISRSSGASGEQQSQQQQAEQSSASSRQHARASAGRTATVSAHIKPSTAASSIAATQAFEVMSAALRAGSIRHAATSVSDDYSSIGTQCDKEPRAETASQVPDDLGLPSTDRSSATGAAGSSLAGASGSVATSLTAAGNFNGLVAFLRWAGRTCELLCEENLVEAINARRTARHDPAALVSMQPKVSAVSIPRFPLLFGRRMVSVAQSPTSSRDFVVAYTPMPDDIASQMIRQGLSVHSHLREASVLTVFSSGALRYVLVCWGVVSSMCYNGDGSVVLAGSRQGVIYAWNLREPAWLHPTNYGAGVTSPNTNNAPGPQPQQASAPTVLKIDSGIRSPSFSTHAGNARQDGDGSLSIGGGSAIVRVMLLESRAEPMAPAPISQEHLNAAERSGNAAAGDNVSAFNGQHQPIAVHGNSRNGDRKALRVGAGLCTLLNDHSDDALLRNAGPGTESNVLSTASAYGSGGNSDGARAFQVACMDDRGRLDLWVVLPLPVPPSSLSSSSSSLTANGNGSAAPGKFVGPHGITSASAGGGAQSAGVSISMAGLVDETDFGRGVTGTLKMVKTTSVTAARASLQSQPRANKQNGGGSSTIGPSTCDMDASPSGLSQFLVSSVDGCVAHVSRYAAEGDKLVPATFASPSGWTTQPPTLPSSTSNEGASSACSAVRYHPSIAGVFAAGFGDGSVAIYSTAHSSPLASWTTPAPSSLHNSNSSNAGGLQAAASASESGSVVTLTWLSQRPCVFIVVTSRGICAVWDLSISTVGPVFSAPILSLPSPAQQQVTQPPQDESIVSASCVGGTADEPSNVSVIAVTSADRAVTLSLSPAFCVPRKNRTSTSISGGTNNGFSDGDETTTMLNILQHLR